MYILMVCSLFCCPAFRFRERVGVPQKHPRKAFRSDGRRKAHESANGAERETIAHAEVRDNDYNNECMRMRKTLTTAVQQLTMYPNTSRPNGRRQVGWLVAAGGAVQLCE